MRSSLTTTPNHVNWDWNLPRLFIKRCREKGNKPKLYDSSGANLSGSDLLLRTFALKRILEREVLSPDEKNVGLLLPPSAGGAVANAVLGISRRVAINLNYTVSESIINSCIEQAEIKQVLTSRRFMDKMGLKIQTKLIYLEDLASKANVVDKAVAFMQAKILPQFLLNQMLGLGRIKQDDPLTIIFTSGSTGNPKGVPLTMMNVGSNIQGFDQIIRVLDSDCFLGVLPFFHSFGFTVTLWGALTLPSAGAYHYSPLEPKQIAKLVEKTKSTVLLGTPTFLRSYVRRIEPEQFKTLEVVVVGAEKMPIPLCDAFEERFGIRPIEGYGATETSPVAAVNVPPSRANANDKNGGLREGSVGRPLPGVSARVVSLEDGSVVNTNVPGMIQISGPNIMPGYLKQPELTAKVMRGEWYETGDVGYIDDDGFIFITGRQSRFSKIGGEMVPHIQVEEEIAKLVGGEEDGIYVAVSSVPDEKKGERLVVLYTKPDTSPSEINKGLSAAGLPNLFIPSEDSYFQVDAIPVLGTGKLDLRGLQKLAREKTGMGAS